MRTRIKICGLTRLEDAELAVSLGADALGFVFWPSSPRAMTAPAVRAITSRLPALPVRVGVFVDMPAPDVARVVGEAGLDVVQLHGDERLDEYAGHGARIIRSVSLVDDHAVARACDLPAAVLPLVDAVDPTRHGGTGQVADWTRAARLSAARPIMLAGGLTAANVADAVRTVRPWVVDVSSGVEAAPGVKSRERLREFFARVADVNAEDE